MAPRSLGDAVEVCGQRTRLHADSAPPQFEDVQIVRKKFLSRSANQDCAM